MITAFPSFRRWLTRASVALTPAFAVRVRRGPGRAVGSTRLRRRTAAARAAVLCALTLCVGSHVVLGVGLDRYWPALRDPEYGCRLESLRRLLAEEPRRPLVIALGSSRTQMGLKPDSLGIGPVPAGPGRADAEPLVFNLGLAGCGPLTQAVVLRRLKEDGVRPDWVLLEVLPPALHVDSTADELLGGDRVSLLKRGDLETARPYCRDPDRMRADWLQSRLAAWSTVRFCLLSHVVPGWLPPKDCRRYLWENTDPLGWLEFPVAVLTPDYRRRQLDHTRSQYAANLADFRVLPRPDRALRQALDFCRAESWRTALYLMPEGPEFRRLYAPGAREEIDRYLAGLGRDYGVPVLDGRDFIPDESEFSDSHHPLPAGARRFSERFGREALGPLLRGR
jgi:hypothetical protein